MADVALPPVRVGDEEEDGGHGGGEPHEGADDEHLQGALDEGAGDGGSGEGQQAEGPLHGAGEGGEHATQQPVTRAGDAEQQRHRGGGGEQQEQGLEEGLAGAGEETIREAEHQHGGDAGPGARGAAGHGAGEQQGAQREGGAQGEEGGLAEEADDEGEGPEAEGQVLEEARVDVGHVAQGEPAPVLGHVAGDDLIELRVPEVGVGPPRGGGQAEEDQHGPGRGAWLRSAHPTLPSPIPDAPCAGRGRGPPTCTRRAPARRAG